MNTEQHNAERMTEVVRKFNTMDLPTIMTCFSDDVVTRYNGGVPLVGKNQLLAYLTERYRDISNYALEKRIRLSQEDVVAVEACARYTKRSTGEDVVAVIHEFLEFRGAQICRWDYVGHVLPALTAGNTAQHHLQKIVGKATAYPSRYEDYCI